MEVWIFVLGTLFMIFVWLFIWEIIILKLVILSFIILFQLLLLLFARKITVIITKSYLRKTGLDFCRGLLIWTSDSAVLNKSEIGTSKSDDHIRFLISWNVSVFRLWLPPVFNITIKLYFGLQICVYSLNFQPHLWTAAGFSISSTCVKRGYINSIDKQHFMHSLHLEYYQFHFIGQQHFITWGNQAFKNWICHWKWFC